MGALVMQNHSTQDENILVSKANTKHCREGKLDCVCKCLGEDPNDKFSLKYLTQVKLIINTEPNIVQKLSPG